MNISWNRRAVLAQLAAVAGTAMMPRAAFAQNGVMIHRHEMTMPYPVNAYIIEGPDGLVTIDATLTVPSATDMAAKVAALGKPLRGMLLTHAHPDHYAGLDIIRGDSQAPIIALEAVKNLVAQIDVQRDATLKEMFGPLWPTARIGPDTITHEGETLDFGPGLKFQVIDIGPAESHHDSAFLLDGTDAVFPGDIVYSGMHSYLGDGQNPAWLRAIERLSTDLPSATTLHVGHGPEGHADLFVAQTKYIETFDRAIAEADWSNPEAATAAVVARMGDLLPTQALLFLMQLSISPNARAQGLI